MVPLDALFVRLKSEPLLLSYRICVFFDDGTFRLLTFCHCESIEMISLATSAAYDGLSC